jgi:Flp pilus assembly protein TadB
MVSRRSKRLDQQRELQRAAKIKRRRDQNLMCGIVALTVPIVGVLHGGIAAIGLGSLVGILVAVYFFHAARSGIRHSSKPPESSSDDSYERSLRERTRQGQKTS